MATPLTWRSWSTTERPCGVHPGEGLRDELAELDLAARAFARALAIPGNRVTQIRRGQRGISADTALRLARYFGTSPELWMDLQSDFELRRARGDVGPAFTFQRPMRPGVPSDPPAPAAVLPIRVLPWSTASGSRRLEQTIELARRLAAFQPLPQNPQGQGFGSGDGLLARGAIREHAGQHRDLGDPAATASRSISMVNLVGVFITSSLLRPRRR
jgi:antitoxin HigA-1